MRESSFVVKLFTSTDKLSLRTPSLKIESLDPSLPTLPHLPLSPSPSKKDLHNSMELIYIAICIFLLSMFAIACAMATDSTWLTTSALLLFLLGIGFLLVSFISIVIDFRYFHKVQIKGIKQS